MAVHILFFLVAVAFAVWMILVFAWGGYWQTARFDFDRVATEPLTEWPRIVAIVPARNEADGIAQSVASLCRQDYPGDFSIIIVDDHSEDSTKENARRAVEEIAGKFPAEVITAPPLREGWTGKLSALNAGVEHAGGRVPEFYWFSDADIIHTTDSLRRLVSLGEHQKLDLASLMVLLRTETFAERFLIPPFLYFFLLLYPPRWISSSQSRKAGAAGGCLLLRRAALERIGGLASIRREVIDDCALARSVKRSGGQIWMGLTRASRSRRAYGSFSEIRDMIARTAFTQLNYSALSLLGTLAGLLLVFVLPALLTFCRDGHIWPLAIVSWCLMSISIVPTLIFYRVSPLFSPFLPVAALYYGYATLLSAFRYWLGRGGQWKGRAQAQRRGT